MVHIVLIAPCFSELEKIKAQIIAEKRANDEPTNTTYSEIIFMLIKNYNDWQKPGGNHMLVTLSPPAPNIDTKLYFNVLEKDYEKFLDLNMKFYILHQNDLDDVSIHESDVIIETSFVPEYRKFMNENNFTEK